MPVSDTGAGVVNEDTTLRLTLATNDPAVTSLASLSTSVASLVTLLTAQADVLSLLAESVDGMLLELKRLRKAADDQREPGETPLADMDAEEFE